MSIESTVTSSTSSDSGPYEQFSTCTYDTSCKYVDATTGRCIHETCLLQNQEKPQTASLWYYTCEFCGEIDCIEPNQMKIFLCAQCIERAQAAEKKPFTCVFCGSTQSSNSKIFLSGICDTCFSKLNNAIKCKNCGNA